MRLFKFSSPVEKYKFIIIFFGTIFFIIVGTGVSLKATSNPKFCYACHTMAPQFYTWQVSSHSNIKCTDCHIAPGVDNLVKEKATGVKQLYNLATDTYLAPIKMPNLIPDESCEKCHDMTTRLASASGDVIIDHVVHKKKQVACVICHDGVAHGKISEKQVTYKTDYAKWSKKLAERFMSDTKYTRPQMETCMECHELRRAPLSCDTCHETSMLPEEHKTKGFINKEHMQQAKEDILYCNTCHTYTTENQVEELKKQSAVSIYLSGYKQNHKGISEETTTPKPAAGENSPGKSTDGGKSFNQPVTVKNYAKTNDYCRECHGTRPESHKTTNFMANHGYLAENNRESCLTCHDYRIMGNSPPVVKVGCASCHPSSHNRPDWKRTHPFDIKQGQKIDTSCLRCHPTDKCAGCHVNVKPNINKTKQEGD